MILNRAATLLVRPLVWLVFRPRLRGIEHIPAEGGFVIAPTHLSGFDALAIAYALAGRPLRNMAKNQLLRRPLLGPLVRSLGVFPAHDENGLPGGVDAAAVLARAGEAVVIFPEGARRRPGREHRVRTGAARAALTAGVPLVPAAIRGTDGWRQRRHWQVGFGPRIPLEGLSDFEPGKAALEATRTLWQAITQLEEALDAEARDEEGDLPDARRTADSDTGSR